MQSSDIGVRSKKSRPERFEYLDQLVVEFRTSQSKDAREQVLANLANFAYDPLNYDYFRELCILDLFLENLTSPESNLVKFSVGGLCNLCLDPINKEYIIQNGLSQLVKLLNHDNEDIMLSVITILMFLVTPDSKQEVTKREIVEFMLKSAKSDSVRIKNLATIFLEDYCTEEQVKRASDSGAGNEDTANIPLPN